MFYTHNYVNYISDLTKTGLSYGRSYNRTVLNLKNAQKEAFKVFTILYIKMLATISQHTGHLIKIFYYHTMMKMSMYQ